MSMGITIFNNAVGGGGSAPSGVLFKTIEPSQYTSYRTGDEGWRVQNGWFDYTPPTNPAAVAELDMTSANFFNVLKNPLVVNGVSSKTRFVDVNGVQTFSATGNANLVVIDKLTGLMYSRNNLIASSVWNSAIDNALNYSVVINSNTYDDWHLATDKEIYSIVSQFAGVAALTDTLTGVIYNINTSVVYSSTTFTNNTNNSKVIDLGNRAIGNASKLTSYQSIIVRNARNLITAP